MTKENYDTVDVALILRHVADAASKKQLCNFEEFATPDAQARLWRTADLWQQIGEGKLTLVRAFVP